MILRFRQLLSRVPRVTGSLTRFDDGMSFLEEMLDGSSCEVHAGRGENEWYDAYDTYDTLYRKTSCLFVFCIDSNSSVINSCDPFLLRDLFLHVMNHSHVYDLCATTNTQQTSEKRWRSEIVDGVVCINSDAEYRLVIMSLSGQRFFSKGLVNISEIFIAVPSWRCDESVIAAMNVTCTSMDNMMSSVSLERRPLSVLS
jgi:hypothetical protein